MEAKEPSGSAIIAAITRAAHLFIDDEPKIFHDDFALGFSGIQDETALKSTLDMFYSGMARQTSPEYASSFYISYRAFALIRHRYTEDKLEKATERGVSQYVILGAGLDSFAYRRRDMKDRLRVFEVDHPSSQEWKKRKLEELKIPVPGNLTFVPVDFEQQNLMDELYHHDFKKGSPTFFSWLGVTQYLTEEAIFQTLKDVASTAPGSEIILEYVLSESLLEGEDQQIVAGGRNLPTEPWLSTFSPNDLTERLKNTGFTDIEDFGPEEAKMLYFTGRNDDLSSISLDRLSVSVLRTAHLMKARVA